MANLISQANRLNDVEINNNKPVTSALKRRIGSNINYFLDLFGITDGSTSPSGAFGDIAQDEEVCAWSFNFNSGTALDTPYTILTFSGSDTRHLSWRRKNGSGYYTLDPSAALYVDGPVTWLWNLFNTATFGGPTRNIEIRVNGVLAATSRSLPTKPSFDLLTAPSGTHTITATLKGAAFGTHSFSGTYYKLFV